MTAMWETLAESKREKLFAIMRTLGDEADRYFEKGRERYDMVPVGAALFDETLRGAVRLELVSALRTAPDLGVAAVRAGDAVRVWVCKHNERRPRDVNWQRWSEAGQDMLAHLVASVREVVS